MSLRITLITRVPVENSIKVLDPGTQAKHSFNLPQLTTELGYLGTQLIRGVPNLKNTGVEVE